jgi:hypothetical protein
MFDRGSDWTAWFTKIKWQLVSFKFIAFVIFSTFLASSWVGLSILHIRSIQTAERLYKLGYIGKDHVSTIITHSQTVLYDIALSHLLLFFGTILTAIIAIKGVSYVTNTKRVVEAMKKLEPEASNKENLKQFLQKPGE